MNISMSRHYRSELWGRARSKCQKCGSKESLTVHHKIPRSEGGSNRIENLALLCAPCHGKIHGEPLEGSLPGRLPALSRLTRSKLNCCGFRLSDTKRDYWIDRSTGKIFHWQQAIDIAIARKQWPTKLNFLAWSAWRENWVDSPPATAPLAEIARMYNVGA